MLVKLDRIFSGRCKNHHLVACNSVRFQLNYEAMEKGMKRKYSPRSLDIFCWMYCKNKCWQHALPACCKKCTSAVSKSKRKLLRIFHWITFDYVVSFPSNLWHKNHVYPSSTPPTLHLLTLAIQLAGFPACLAEQWWWFISTPLVEEPNSSAFPWKMMVKDMFPQVMRYVWGS